jgi:cobalt-zinc-cadmium efflux system outer membrane protein
MHRSTAAAALAATLLLWPGAGAAQDNALTLDQVLQMARDRAPGIVSARTRIDEARGRLAGASVLLRENPVLESSAGRRSSAGGSFVDADLGLSQTFELGGRRGSRIAGAEAGVARAEAASEDASRRLLSDVAGAFLRVLAAEEQVRLARQNEGVATEIHRIAERRLQAGDIPQLDVRLAQSALSRARSDVRAAEARHIAALGELRILLGMDADEPLAVRGDLRDRRRYALADLSARAPERSDLRALAAERREADAEVRLGRGLAWPELGLGVRYQREEQANILLGTLTFSLPVFERGQGTRAEASARSRRLSLELDAGRRTVRTEVRTAFDVYQRRVDAVEELERNALPLLDSNEALSRRSYESGQLGLPDLWVVRREVLGTRLEYLNRLLEAATAGVQLEASAGVLR